MDRRLFLASTLGLPLLARPALAADLPMEVFKTPTCGYCSAWIAHIEQAGFVEGYFIEGLVPAADVQRLLRKRPDALGLTIPGTPIGSPGMEKGNRREAFATLLVEQNGDTETL